MKTFFPVLPAPKLLKTYQNDEYFAEQRLSAYRYDRLGYYDRAFTDPSAEEVVRQFQQDLTQVEHKIELRNKNRLVEYNFLKPSLVINSISI